MAGGGDTMNLAGTPLMLQPEEAAILAAEPWFAGLHAEQQQQLLELAQRRALQKDELLFQRGDPFCGIYLLLQGQLTISGLHRNGGQAVLTILASGDWFGEIAWFDQMPRTHDVMALSDSQLLQLSKSDLRQLVGADPVWWQRWSRLLTGKLRQVFVELEDRAFLSAEQRLARRLCQFSRNGQLRLTLHQEQLGQMLSLSRQTTNLLLRQLVQAGIIQTRYGVIEILNRPALERRAQA